MVKHDVDGDDFVLKAVEGAKIGLWHWDIDKEIININATLAEIIGYTVHELSPITLEKWMQLKHPDDATVSKHFYEQLKKGERSGFLFEHRLRHKNGNWVTVQSNGRVTKHSPEGKPSIMAGTFIDISELHHSRKHLQYRYEIEKLVASISSDFVGIPNRKLNFTIQKTLEKIGRFACIDRCYVFLLKQNNTVMDNTHEWCAPGIHPEIQNLQDLPTSIFPWWMKKMNRLEHIHISDTAIMPKEASQEQETLKAQDIRSLLVVPIHYKKNLLGFMGFDSVRRHKEWPEADIHLLETVGNTIANALNAKRNQEMLVKAKEAAEESNRLKSAFLATMNHELRTPLHHILGFSELLRSNQFPKEQTGIFANKIYESGKNLLQIIEDILSLALADQSEIKIRNEVFSGPDLFIQHKSLLEEILFVSNKEKDITLIYNPSTEFLSNRFIADRNKINQVILNLFKNAIKFTDTGSVEYGIQLDNPQQLTFYVKDSGMGIPKSQQELIFEFFRQGDDSHTRLHSGIGIGLSISKKITGILKGQLTVESTPRKGSTFRFSVPVETITDSMQVLQTRTKTMAPPDLSGHRLLMIDDDPSSLFLLKNLLQETKADLLHLENSKNVTSFLTENHPVDLVLLDLKMPDEESLLAAKQLSGAPYFYPVIALTAHSLLDEKEKALHAGCKATLSKPLEPGLLFEAITSALARK
ncbi:hybrid sensor histidine kinase/response regulator [Gaoshiqia sediminis]|uniref:histidine kinase n=1 Tax=Gaoshiqia sediminis TaxID=2986998 RepID=A0AA41Y9B2_9BACT|nr:ATP-binding protein [Gaoshiqia sediminis]MCW0484290.1 ATP-binding protein [Gaoshiqia sediminis]